MGDKIPNHDNEELMKSAFPQVEEPAPDPEAERDAVNEGAFSLMDEKTTYKNRYF